MHSRRLAVVTVSLSFFVVLPARAQDVGYTSLRIEALREAIAEDGRRAISRFWDEMEAAGAPIVEPVEGEPDYRLLTFVYRDADAAAVHVDGHVCTNNPHQDRMYRLGDTDVWFVTYRVRKDLRSSYHFRVFDVSPRVAPVGRDRSPRERSIRRPDPLNPNGDARDSHIVLPDALSIAWNEPYAGDGGTLHKHEDFESAILGNARTIGVYTPAAYSTTADPYPLLIVFDGESYTGTVRSQHILDHAIANGALRPLVAMLIHNGANNRALELGANPDFANFIGDEWLPWLREGYNVTTDPTDTYVMGSSFGGLASAFLAIERPDVVRNVYAQAGSFWWGPGYDWAVPDPEVEGNYLAGLVMDRDLPPIRFYLENGLYDGGNTATTIANRYFRDVATLRGHEVVAFALEAGGHDYALWATTMVKGLSALMPPVAED